MKIEKYAIICILLVNSLAVAQNSIVEQPQKIIILKLKFEGKIVQTLDTKIIYGKYPTTILRQDDISLRLISVDEKLVNTYYMADPRIVFDGPYNENASFTVVLPYINSANVIEIYDKDQQVTSIDITDAINSFCSTSNGICDLDCSNDVDCIEQPSTGIETAQPSTESSETGSVTSVNVYLIISIIVLIVAVILFYFYYMRSKEDRILRKVQRSKR